MPATNPWDRRPDETDKAWIAFVAYRDLGAGKRTIAKATEALGRPTGYARSLEAWSGQHAWRERAAAYDGWVDRRTVQPAVARERAEMAERHLKLGRALQGRAAQGLAAIKPDKLKPAEVAALAKSGVDIERVAAGEPTEIQEHKFAAATRDRLRSLFPDDAGATA